MYDLINSSYKKLLSNQRLVTSTGYKEVESIGVGENILNHLGEYKRVIDKQRLKKGDSRVLELSMNGVFFPLRLREDSLVYAYRGKKEDRSVERFKWFMVGNLNPGDMIVHNLQGNTLEESLIDKYLDDEVVAKFLGYYTIEGFLSRAEKKVTFHIDTASDNMENEIREVCYKAFGVEMERYTYMNELFITVVNDEIYNLCLLFGDKNKDKVVPESVINASISYLRAFVSPLVSLNKDKRTGSYFRPSASLDMFLGFQRILFKLGGFSNIYDCKSKNDRFSYFALVLNAKELLNVPQSEVKSNWFSDGNFAYIKVTDVRGINIISDSYELEIDGDTSCCSTLAYCR